MSNPGSSNEVMVRVLQKCAETFRRYEANHLAKNTPEASEKARQNADMALLCETVVAGKSIDSITGTADDQGLFALEDRSGPINQIVEADGDVEHAAIVRAPE